MKRVLKLTFLGWDPTKTAYYDDIWVLSLPSFTWIKVRMARSKRITRSG